MRVVQVGFETGSEEQLFDFGNATIESSDTAGDWSLYSATRATGTGLDWCGISVPAEEFYLGFAAHVIADSTYGVMRFSNAGDMIAFLHQDTDGFYRIYKDVADVLDDEDVSGVPLATSANAWPFGWHFYEMHWDAAGTTFELRIDGSVEMSFSDADIDTDATRVDWGTGWRVLDDIVVNDTNGGVNDSWSGIVGIVGIYPEDEGDETDLAPSTGDNWDTVDETPPDDSDYVSGNVADDYDLYELTDLPAYVDEVHCVGVWIRADKAAAGTVGVAPMLKHSTMEDEGDTQYVTGTPAYYSQLYDEDPITTTTWDQSDIDAMQAGEKVKA